MGSAVRLTTMTDSLLSHNSNHDRPRKRLRLTRSHRFTLTAVIVHFIDGTYELFRHFYGLRRFTKGVDRPYGAVVGVLQTVLQMIDP